MRAAEVLYDLGPISRAGALAGVEATASIPASSAVTFRFEVQAGGDYTLFVRHDGAGLQLTALTPRGATSIDAGSAGPFHAISLDLKPGTYEVTAEARGGQPLFIDWELLLNAGVGQAAGSTPPTILPAVTMVMLGGSAPLGTSPPGSIGPAAASTIMAGTDVALSSPLGDSVSPARYLVGGMMGRTAGDPMGSPPVVAPAPALGAVQTGLSMVQLEAALLVGLQPGDIAVADGEASSESAAFSWFTALTRAMAGEAAGEAEGELDSTRVDPESLAVTVDRGIPAEPEAETAAIDPGILVGAVAVTVASRRVIKRRREGSLPALTDARTPRAIRALLGRSLDLT